MNLGSPRNNAETLSGNRHRHAEDAAAGPPSGIPCNDKRRTPIAASGPLPRKRFALCGVSPSPWRPDRRSVCRAPTGSAVIAAQGLRRTGCLPDISGLSAPVRSMTPPGCSQSAHVYMRKCATVGAIFPITRNASRSCRGFPVAGPTRWQHCGGDITSRGGGDGDLTALKSRHPSSPVPRDRYAPWRIL